MNEMKKSNYRYLKDCKYRVLKYGVLILFGIWSMVFANIAFASSVANNERERVTPAQNLSSYKSSKYQTYKETSVITDNDSASVIASETLVKRGNPQCNTANIDCHDSTLRAESRNDDGRVDCYESANADSSNDGNYCHIEQNEVSQSNNRDTSLSAKPQYDKDDKTKFDNVKSSLRALQRNAWQSTIKNIGGNPQCDTETIDCHENPSGFSRNDGNKINPQKYIKLAQVDSIRTDFTQIDFTKTTAESMKIDSTSQAFDKPSRYNKLKSEPMGETITQKDLGRIVAYGSPDIKADSLGRYQNNAGTISKGIIDSSPSGNGDIGSILRLLPNVQFDNAQSKSTTPGEIDPANISISGGLFYQNNFQLDGFNMNNDLDPNGGTTNGPDAIRGGRSQGLNVDTSLLESINVLDSNVSAAYGGFSGGVVEANVRKPRTDGWHADFSYQHTADYFTQYFIDESQESNFFTSSDENYQPKFHKHIVRANTEGYITDDLGLIASFSTTQSFIPLQAYSTSATNKGGTENNATRTQKRQSYNAFIKANYNPTETLTLEASLAYMPQFNSYYNAIAKDSYYEMRSGGWQTGLKALWQAPVGLWTNTIGYSYLENSRRSDANYFMSWYASSEKNWAINSANRASEGGYGDMDQLQHSLNYKSDFAFDTINLGKFKHNFRVGAEIGYQSLAKNRLNDYYGFSNPVQIQAGQSCPNTPDNLGLWSCSSSTPLYGNQATWANGQYFNRTSMYREAGKVEFDNVAYGVFAEDEMTLDFGKGGELNARFGLRLDGDNYMDKITLAPRYAMNYISPAPIEWQSVVTFGANRYYGRNLFAYRFYDYNQRATKTYSRNSPNDDWVATPNTNSTSPYKFNQLNVPFSDELMGGITQNLDMFSVGIKYIHRNGKDEIMRLRRSDLNLPTESGYQTNYTTWTNDGASESHIISLIVQNIKPIKTYGINHYYLFAFDYTKTERSYNLYAYDDDYYENTKIMYNGQIIKYRDRPVENYALPFTIRLNTTHSFDIGRTKWMLNNFFRYKAGYDRMVIIPTNSPDRDPTFAGDQYGKMHFKGTFGWDMRVGFEVDFYKSEKWRHTLYVNVDIYNVLNSKNMTTLSGTNGAMITGFAASSSVAVYEVGRQFWVQVGYKF